MGKIVIDLTSVARRVAFVANAIEAAIKEACLTEAELQAIGGATAHAYVTGFVAKSEEFHQLEQEDAFNRMAERIKLIRAAQAFVDSEEDSRAGMVARMNLIQAIETPVSSEDEARTGAAK